MIRDEDELAAVLGHEMAHVVANHPAERMSASIVALITISAISMLFDVTGRLPSALAHMIYLLPNSRATEVGSIPSTVVEHGGSRRYIDRSRSDWTEYVLETSSAALGQFD